MPRNLGCTGLNRRGEPCGAPARKGTDRCSAHTADLPDSQRFGSVAQANEAGKLGGRPRRPREIELIQEVADEFKDELRAVYSDGITATRAVIVGMDGGEQRVEYVPDHQQRLATAREIQDRLHGRPRQTMDVNAQSQHLAVHVDMSDPRAREAIADVLRSRPAADAAG